MDRELVLRHSPTALLLKARSCARYPWCLASRSLWRVSQRSVRIFRDTLFAATATLRVSSRQRLHSLQSSLRCDCPVSLTGPNIAILALQCAAIAVRLDTTKRSQIPRELCHSQSNRREMCSLSFCSMCFVSFHLRSAAPLTQSLSCASRSPPPALMITCYCAPSEPLWLSPYKANCCHV